MHPLFSANRISFGRCPRRHTEPKAHNRIPAFCCKPIFHDTKPWIFLERRLPFSHFPEAPERGFCFFVHTAGILSLSSSTRVCLSTFFVIFTLRFSIQINTFVLFMELKTNPPKLFADTWHVYCYNLDNVHCIKSQSDVQCL